MHAVGDLVEAVYLFLQINSQDLGFVFCAILSKTQAIFFNYRVI
jgi:hypothetical protein